MDNISIQSERNAAVQNILIPASSCDQPLASHDLTKPAVSDRTKNADNEADEHSQPRLF